MNGYPKIRPFLIRSIEVAAILTDNRLWQNQNSLHVDLKSEIP